MIEQLLGLDGLYQAFDVAAAELEKELGVSLCMENCGKCCLESIVLVHRIEAIFAVSTCLGTGVIQQLADRAEGWLLERDKGAPSYEGPQLGQLSPKMMGEFFSLTKEPCPFLLLDKKCLLYRGRPLVCRAYGITHMAGPTADTCPRKLGRNESESTRAWLDLPQLKTAVASYFQSIPDADWRIVGLLPTAIFKHLRPEKYREYIADNRIASAKLIGLPHQYPGLLWQEDMFKGVPMPVASGKE